MSNKFSNTDGMNLRGWNIEVPISDSTHLVTEVVKGFLSCDDTFDYYMPNDRDKPLNINAVILSHPDCCSSNNPSAVIDVYCEIDFAIDCCVEAFDCNDENIKADKKLELDGIERDLSVLLIKIKEARIKHLKGNANETI